MALRGSVLSVLAVAALRADCAAAPLDVAPPAGRVVILIRPGATAAEIQRRLDAAPSGAIIRLSAGDFAFDRPVYVQRPGIALLGEGTGRTVIHLKTAGCANPTALIVGEQDSNSRPVKLLSDLDQGDRRVRLAGNIRPGDILLVSEANDERYTAALDAAGVFHTASKAPLRQMMARVSAAFAPGEYLLSSPSPFSFDLRRSSSSVVDLASGMEVGGFSIVTDVSRPDPQVFDNVMPCPSNIATVDVRNVTSSSVHDIKVRNSISSAFQFSRAFRITANRLSAEGAVNKGGEGNGYAYRLTLGFENTFSNLEDRDMRHSFLFSAEAAEFYNNISIIFTNRNVDFHGGDDRSNTVTVLRSEQEYNPAGPAWAAVSERSRSGARVTLNSNDVKFGWLRGSRAAELVHGLDNGAYLDGEGGNDTLYSGAGGDTLVGGPGDDLLFGGEGCDRFVFRPGDGDDIISDLGRCDRIDIRAFHHVSAVAISVQARGGDVWIDFGSGEGVQVRNSGVAAVRAALIP